MRISDWSSDVCSSDLRPPPRQLFQQSWKDRLISQSPFRRPIEFSPPHGRCAPDCAQPQRRGNPPPPGSTRRRLPSPGSRPLQRRSFRLYTSPFAVPSDPRLSLNKCQRLHDFGCLVKPLDADWSALPIGIGEGRNTPPQGTSPKSST